MRERLGRIERDMARAKLSEQRLAHGRRTDAGSVSALAQSEARKRLASENAAMRARLGRVTARFASKEEIARLQGGGQGAPAVRRRRQPPTRLELERGKV